MLCDQKKTTLLIIFLYSWDFFPPAVNILTNVSWKNPLRVTLPGPEGFLSRTHAKARAWMDSVSDHVIREEKGRNSN